MEVSSFEDLEKEEKILAKIERAVAREKARQAKFFESLNNIGKELPKPIKGKAKRDHDKKDIINM